MVQAPAKSKQAIHELGLNYARAKKKVMGIHIGGWEKLLLYFAKLNIEATFDTLEKIGVHGDHGKFISCSNCGTSC